MRLQRELTVLWRPVYLRRHVINDIIRARDSGHDKYKHRRASEVRDGRFLCAVRSGDSARALIAFGRMRLFSTGHGTRDTAKSLSERSAGEPGLSRLITATAGGRPSFKQSASWGKQRGSFRVNNARNARGKATNVDADTAASRRDGARYRESAIQRADARYRRGTSAR